jgi:nucleotide-binding universal stress UspA family protein
MRILHPTDFSRTAEKARALALALAQRTDAELHVVHVQQRFETDAHRFLRPSLDTLNPELLRRVEEERTNEVKRIQERLRNLTAERGTWELRWGTPVTEVLEASEKADLIVMGAHGANRLDAFFLGGTAGRVVRRASVPVLTVRDEARTSDVRRVLLATDFGEASRHAWKVLDGWRSSLGLEVVLVHVVDDPRFAADADYATRAREALDAMRHDDSVRTELREGNPIEVLPALAEEVGADVIAVGVRRHAGAVGLLLGSRADALLRSSPIPVLSVPYRDESA